MRFSKSRYVAGRRRGTGRADRVALILENYTERTDDAYILERETWWKQDLCSREHSYNAN